MGRTLAEKIICRAAGRAKLIEGASALTDARPGLSNEQIVSSIKNLALLQRATGVGGAQGFGVVQSLQTNLNLPEDQAVDVATNLLNAGFDANSVEQIASRGGNAGSKGTIINAVFVTCRKINPTTSTGTCSIRMGRPRSFRTAIRSWRTGIT